MRQLLKETMLKATTSSCSSATTSMTSVAISSMQSSLLCVDILLHYLGKKDEMWSQQVEGLLEEHVQHIQMLATPSAATATSIHQQQLLASYLLSTASIFSILGIVALPHLIRNLRWQDRYHYS